MIKIKLQIQVIISTISVHILYQCPWQVFSLYRLISCLLLCCLLVYRTDYVRSSLCLFRFTLLRMCPLGTMREVLMLHLSFLDQWGRLLLVLDTSLTLLLMEALEQLGTLVNSTRGWTDFEQVSLHNPASTHSVVGIRCSTRHRVVRSFRQACISREGERTVASDLHRSGGNHQASRLYEISWVGLGWKSKPVSRWRRVKAVLHSVGGVKHDERDESIALCSGEASRKSIQVCWKADGCLQYERANLLFHHTWSCLPRQLCSGLTLSLQVDRATWFHLVCPVSRSHTLLSSSRASVF